MRQQVSYSLRKRRMTSPVMPTVGITQLGEHQAEDRKITCLIQSFTKLTRARIEKSRKSTSLLHSHDPHLEGSQEPSTPGSQQTTWNDTGMFSYKLRKEAQCKLAGHNKRGCYAEAQSLGKRFDKSLANDIEKGKVEV
ncbi:hypothetical protein RHMOL_Rhmol09G0005600 [Rhododendron molle]|uniref:Uncharacterized protein n=1 Tax=Rhododendron molle TaxID=49168 RepID=A0ACC0M9V6_RHOML|nr:hypothetical protein RHMOL_Rhmol09G0005600 [Rhododendron molle]